jgi:arylsulfatase A-like enzyme
LSPRLIVTLLLLTFFLRAPLAFGQTRGGAGSRPNILFIFGDDQAHRTIGSYEAAPGWVNTPHIDALAQSGTRFTDAYAGSWCMASRAMMLTGKHPHAIDGITMNINPWSSYDPEIFKWWTANFRKNGYSTALVGKWHLSPDTGHGRDWDHSVVWNHAEPEKANDYYVDQNLNFDGGPYTPVGGYSTDNYTKYAVDFIEREHDKPWFLWLCYDGVHGPFLSADRHADDYPASVPVDIPLDIFGPRPDKPAYMKQYTVWKRDRYGEVIADPDKRQPKGLRGNSKPFRDAVRQYHRAVRALDDGVGRVMQALKDSGQLDNTLVVYTADQGFAWGQHGFSWKLAPYDSNMRVPYIVSMPSRFPRGQVCTTPVTTLHLIPTFHKLAGIDLPWEMHGHDLTPLLENARADWPHPVLQEHFFIRYGRQTDKGVSATYNVMKTENTEGLNAAQLYDPSGDTVGGIPWWLSLRQGKYKYIRTLVANEIEELYDIENDPEELINLAVDPAYRTTLTDYRERLVNELKRTQAGLIDNLPQPKVISLK